MPRTPWAAVDRALLERRSMAGTTPRDASFGPAGRSLPVIGA
ncbi:MAG TPA: hypothetical protein VLA76_07740 [Candidatus Angelobacter sp.]|nr:hypothetical protein [Candidatus Angelobacter sp.]